MKAGAPRSLPRLALASALLVPLGARHLWFWGGGLAEFLNILQMLLAGLLFFLLQRLHGRALGEGRAWRPLLLAGAAFAVLPPFLSEDVRDYLMRGVLLGVHGANPYLSVAADFPADPFVAAGLPAWGEMRCPYGPLAVEAQGLIGLAAEGVRRLAGMQAAIAAGILLFKALGWLSLLLMASVAARAWEDRAEGERARLALLASPFLLLELVGMAHNEAWMVLPALAGVVAAEKGRFGRAGALLVAASLVKPPVLLLWPLAAARAKARGGLRRCLLGTAAVALPALAWSHLRFFPDLEALAVFRTQADLTRTSLRLFLGLGLESVGLASELSLQLARGATQGSFLILYGYWVVQAWRGPVPLAALSLRTLLAAAFLPLGLTNPWYLAWALPFAYLPGVEGARRWAGAVELCAPLSYSVYLGTRTLGLLHQGFQLALLALPFVPWIGPGGGSRDAGRA